MTNGRLLLWLKGEARQDQITIPKHIADEIYDRLILAGKISTFVSILSSVIDPEDDVQAALWREICLLQGEWEKASLGPYLLKEVTMREYLAIQDIKPEKKFFRRLWPSYWRNGKAEKPVSGMVTTAKNIR